MNANMKPYRNKFASLDYKWQQVTIQRTGKEGALDFWKFWSASDRSYKKYAYAGAYYILMDIISS